MKNLSKTLILFCGISFVVFACREGDQQKEDHGQLVFQFEHFVEAEQLAFDQMIYKSEAGNEYEVTEIQYFVSDLTLHKENGEKIELSRNNFAHYIDTNLPNTSTWVLDDEIAPGEYKSISMIFGIKGEKNEPFMFTDPPESDMLWPINLGGDQGGYHYMKLNGFWKNEEGVRTPFNFHLGVGQERDADNNIVGFIQNWIEIELPSSSFSISTGEVKTITIRMDVNEWWKTPNIYDHNIHGGKIMQNQEAMRMGAENGISVFKVSKIDEGKNAL